MLNTVSTNANVNTHANLRTQNLNAGLQPDLYQAIDSIKSKLTPDEIQFFQHYLAADYLQKLYTNSDIAKPAKSKPDCYNPALKIAFNVLKLFCLFLFGTGITFVISASLQATTVVTILISVFSQVFVPLAVVTFSIVATAIILESFK